MPTKLYEGLKLYCDTQERNSRQSNMSQLLGCETLRLVNIFSNFLTVAERFGESA